MSVMLWEDCMRCIWLNSIVYMRWFRFRTAIEVIPLAQVLLWLLDADAALPDPKIKPWIHQGKITLKILWWYYFYVFPYHLLPSSVEVKRPITRDLWFESVQPLWFCFSLYHLFFQKCHKSLVCSAVDGVWLYLINLLTKSRNVFDNLC